MVFIHYLSADHLYGLVGLCGIGLNAQQDNPTEDDGKIQIELATEDFTNTNPIAQQGDPIEEDDNLSTELATEDSSNAIPIAQQVDPIEEDGNLQTELANSLPPSVKRRRRSP